MSRALPKNFAAQGYAQVVTVAVQLGALPILIATWGVEAFGVWALLTALPSYLAFSDFGFTFVAKNQMSMQVARGDRGDALATFQSIFAALALIALGLGGGLVALAYVVPLERAVNLGPVSATVARDVLALQILTALGYQFVLLLSAGVRCEGRAA